MSTDEARRIELKATVGELATALKQWLGHQADLGADAIPFPQPEEERPMPAPAAPLPRPAAAPQAVAAPVVAARAAIGDPEETLESVRQSLGDCNRCKLHEGRQNIVFGVGNPNADLVIVGEAPGRDEDRTGEPFVGRAGRLLTRMVAALELERRDVYICNVVKCRPPNNRNPEPDEVAACGPFMHRQIRSIRPKVIMSVGAVATRNVLETDMSVGRLRGDVRSFLDVPVVVTYHPAYLLREPRMKRAVWEDLLLVRRLLRQ